MDDIIREIPMDKGLSEEEAKEIRKEEWRAAIESELQPLIMEAAKIQKCINEAKTQTKKDFFNKKFNKIKGKVRKYVNLLQALGDPKAVNNTHDNLIAYAEEQEALIEGETHVVTANS